MERLTALDASFLAAETPTAHMHVGWAAVFEPPQDGAGLPSFVELRSHIAGRLDRAPRYMQRVEQVPLGLHQPVWTEDPDFDLDHHLRHTVARDLDAVIDAVMSEPLPRHRPLWQIWVADQLDDGQLALVGKVHHCMVDGLAAVELGTMLLDADAERPPFRRFKRPEVEASPPDPVQLLADSVLDRLGDQARVARASLRALTSPTDIPRAGARMVRTLVHTALPPAPATSLNGPSSPRRHLGRASRPLEDLKQVGERFGTTVNDVLLAASAGALGTLFAERGEQPSCLKAMVPVSVRGETELLGNRISFIFVELPCDEVDPLVRLMRVNRETGDRKRSGIPAVADAALQAVSYAPRSVQRVLTQMVSSPRTFNLVVSNIPGPRVPLYLRGCRLQEAWPVVPLAENHALSIGMTTIGDQACFGLYVDADAMPDADDLALYLEEAVDELVSAAQ